MNIDILSNPFFKKWFGHSKIKDAYGNPLIVYHGSYYKFIKINIDKSLESLDSYYGKGFYLSSNKNYAKTFGSNLYEFYVCVENPLNISALSRGDEEDLTDFIISSLPQKISFYDISYFYKYIKGKTSKYINDLFLQCFDNDGNVIDKNIFKELLLDTIKSPENFKYGNLQDFALYLTEYAERERYDGIISDKNFSEIVIFNSLQAKSATDNNGMFKINSNNIYENIRFKEYKRIFSENLDYINVAYLTTLYKDFNKLYFDNLLNVYPIKVKSLKSVGASVKSIGIKNKPETWEIKEIVFSNQLLLTEDEVKGIMLHEMIHVKLIENSMSEIGGQHGMFFENELENLQKKVDFKIPITEDITKLQVNSNVVKKKEVIAVILNDLKSIALFNINLKNSIVDNLSELSDIWLNKFNPIVVISNDLELQKYPIQRIFDKRKYKQYIIDSAIAKRIIDNGNILKIFESYNNMKIYKRIFEDSYDVYKKYISFNNLFFEKRLPIDIPINYENKKAKRIAQVTFSPKEEYIKSLDINTYHFNKLSDKNKDAVLIHEMIHIWVHVIGLRRGGNLHQGEFLNKAKEIENKTGLNIHGRFYRDSEDYSDEEKIEVYAIIKTFGRKFLKQNVVSIDFYSNERDALQKAKGLVVEKYFIHIYKIKANSPIISYDDIEKRIDTSSGWIHYTNQFFRMIMTGIKKYPEFAELITIL